MITLKNKNIITSILIAASLFIVAPSILAQEVKNVPSSETTDGVPAETITTEEMLRFIEEQKTKVIENQKTGDAESTNGIESETSNSDNIYGSFDDISSRSVKDDSNISLWIVSISSVFLNLIVLVLLLKVINKR